MFQSARHWLPIVNGYGANHPLAHYFVLDQLVTMFPNIDSLCLVRALGVRYVVFHPDYGRYSEVRHAARRFERRLAAYRENLKLVKKFTDRGVFDSDLGALGGERVYRVSPEEPPSVYRDRRLASTGTRRVAMRDPEPPQRLRSGLRWAARHLLHHQDRPDEW